VPSAAWHSLEAEAADVGNFVIAVVADEQLVVVAVVATNVAHVSEKRHLATLIDECLFFRLNSCFLSQDKLFTASDCVS